MTTTPTCQICGKTADLYRITIPARGSDSPFHYACSPHIGTVIEAECATAAGITGITVMRVQQS